MPYVATINVPGYLPTDDDPPVFDTPSEAWEYLATERARTEEGLVCNEDCENGPACPWSIHADLTDTYAELKAEGDANSLGTVYADTPGYHGDHDLGLAYTVTQI